MGRHKKHAATGFEDTVGVFLYRAEELRRARLFSGRFTLHYSINYDRLRGAAVSLSQPDEEDLRSCLLTLRQFLMDDEPIHLGRFHNQLELHLTGGPAREALRAAHEAWRHAARYGPIEWLINERRVEPECVARLYINGYYFHNDPDESQLLGSLQGHDWHLTRWHFMNFVADTTAYVLTVANIVRCSRQDGALVVSQ